MRQDSLATSLQKGEAALDRGQVRDACKHLARALTIDPTSLTGHFYMALAKMRLGLLREAEKHASAVLEQNPKEAHANLNLGVIREKRRDIELAKRYYLREIALNPRSPHAYYNLGQIYFRRKEWKSALSYLLKSYRRRSGAPLLVDDVAWAAYKAGDLRTERKIYREVLEKNPRNVWALNNLGATYIDTKSRREADELLRSAERLQPDDKMIKRNLARIKRRKRNGSHPKNRDRKGVIAKVGDHALTQRSARRRRS